MKGPVLNLPNLISLSRIPLGLAACLFVYLRWVLPAAAVIFLAMLSDYLDGIVARRTCSVSDWGKIFDPLADKVAIGAFIVTLAAVGAVPLWFVILFLTRDVLIAAGGVYLTARLGSPPSSNLWGKCSSLAVSLYLTLAAAEYVLERELWPPGPELAGLDPLGLLALGFVMASLFVYFSESVKKLRRPRSGQELS
ncbi:MAG: CDP-alcohol phosphatidyltransferase family protein [Candidatus Aegiribacteria sp.]